MEQKPEDDFLELDKDTGSGDLNVLDSDHEKAKPRAQIDKQNLGKFAVFVGAAALALGGLYYLKKPDSSANSSEETSDMSIAKPVEGDPLDTMGFNPLPSEQRVPELAASMPLPQMPNPEENADRLPEMSEAELAAKAQEDAMRSAREKSGILINVDGGGSMSPSSNMSEEMKQLPPELQALYGAMGMSGSGTAHGMQSSQSNGNGTGHQLSAAQSMGGRFGTNQLAPMASAAYRPSRSLLIQQGKIIDAALETEIRSDMPSVIIARVTEDVYGETGRYPLLPAGTRVFGEYSSNVRPGQTEVAAMWRRAITPQGVEISLDSPATNNLGVAGMSGSVNNHYGQIFGTAAVLSVLGVASATAGVSTSDQNNSIAAYRSEVSRSMTETARNMIGRYSDIPPTISVPAGTRIKILVAQDLDFSSLMQ
ncbi:MAG: TrbI/VirB10 family protein [Neisseria animaloris]|nr:TrbI/VirB10 family protein [Neisseria animaloris]